MQENKHISTGLAIAACVVLSLAANAATDNEWVVYTGDDASTDFNFAKNWSPEGKTGDGSFFYRNGTGVKNSSIDVTFAGAYTLPRELKLENNSDGNGLVTFRADQDDYGLSVSGNLVLGYQDNLGALVLDKGAYGFTDMINFLGGALTVGSGVYLSCTNNLDTGNGNNARDTVLNINGGTVSVVNAQVLFSRTAGKTTTCNISNGNLLVKNLIQLGHYGTGIMNLNGGIVHCGGEFRLGSDGEESHGKVYLNDGEISTDSKLRNGGNGVGDFYMCGGSLYCGDEFWLGNGTGSVGTFTQNGGTTVIKNYTCVGYGSGSGKFIMNGGTYTQSNQKFIVGQGNANDPESYGEVVINGGTVTVPTLWMPENAKRGTLKMNGGEFIVTGESQLSRNSGAGKGTLELNGGVFTLNYLSSSSGTGGEIIFNGGTLAARASREDFIPDIANLKLTIAAGGAVIDTDGHSVTIADTFENADGLVGNGMIWKKGLGTLTISSNLDLERTFKFTINQGVGPIALTGSANTLGEGKKISVALDPVEVEMNTPYVLLTGLDTSYTKEAHFDLPSNNGFYSYTWTLENGELSVALGYVEGAPVTAEYSAANETWEYYNASHEILQGASGSAFTSYVFCGNEPDGAFGSISASHSVILRSGTILVSSPVSAGIVTIPAESTAVLSGSEGASFKAKRLVNNGTLTFAGTISVDSLELTGAVAIADGARVELSRPQTIAAAITGSGTLALSGGKFTCASAGVFGAHDGASRFDGTIEVGAGTQLDSAMDGQYVRLGGAVVRLTGGSTVYLGGANGSHCSNDFDIAGTGNVIYTAKANMFMTGSFTGTGEVVVRTDGERGPRPSGDNSQFAGVFTLRNVSTQADTGFHGANATSAAGKWIIDTDNDNRVVDFVAKDGTFHVGELYQSVASTSLRVTQTGTGIVVGERSGGESVINGRFTGNAFSFTKLGATSWLTLGQGFAAVANSTFNFSAGGICFNLPPGETEPTSLTNHTVTIDSSVKIRVAMTQAQYEALDLNEEYLVAKLPTNPGYKPETELLVDGVALDTPAAARWCVRFKSFPAVDETPAYIGAVLRRKSSGLMIIFM